MRDKTRILIIDDTYDKTQVIFSIIKDIPDCETDLCASSREAIKRIRLQHYDLLIIDLQIPSELGDQISAEGGKDLLEFITVNEHLNRPTHIIGVTAHQESYDSCRQYFLENGWPLLLGVDDQSLVRSIVDAKVRHTTLKPHKIDIAIVTALHKIELEAVLSLPCNWKEERFADDNNIYYFGTLELVNGEIKTIVATSCSRMGMSSAAATTMKVCSKLSPDTIVMTGILAGVEGKTNFGDILVADPCWDWGSGKLTIKDGAPKFLNAPHQISLDTTYRTIFQEISAKRLYLDEICNNWAPSSRPSTYLNLHVGPVATGAVVLEDPNTVDIIVDQHRETIGVEMEAYGFAYAASIAEKKSPISIIIKSVCDFANPDKNDNWQAYAAYTSAQLTYRFLINNYQ